MSRKKNLAAGIFCGILLTGISHTDLVYAASPSLSASADTGSVEEGEYVNVDVELGNNPSISTLGATLNYDSSVLKYDSSTWNGGFSGSDMQMASDTGSEVNLSVVCDDSYVQDGTVVTVRFQAVRDTDSIPVTLALRDMADADLSAVSDCQVTSAVHAPQAAPQGDSGGQDNQADETDNSQDKEKDTDLDMVDLENPDETEGIRIVDEERGADEPVTVAAADAGSGAGGEANAAEGITHGETAAPSQSVTKTQTVAAQAAAKPDRNYRTGAGIGIDIYLIGAAACGLLALMLSVRHFKKK